MIFTDDFRKTLCNGGITLIVYFNLRYMYLEQKFRQEGEVSDGIFTFLYIEPLIH